jgi:hypothetical protein
VIVLSEVERVTESMLTARLARWVGIVAGGIMAISAIWWMPYYPVWSLTYVALGVLVVYGLAAHAGRVATR